MFKRFRQNRIDENTRFKFRETKLENRDFILPLFIVDENNYKNEINAMPGVFHFGINMALEEIKKLKSKGLKSVLLFGVPAQKGINQAFDENGLIQKTISKIKSEFSDIEVISDVCLCAYTSDGQCHIGDNDKTCEVLTKIALSHAKAGSDVVAPSDMMDGRVFYINKALKKNSFNNVKIFPYSAKYASAFYGPFRNAVDCAPKSGDRKSYQMDPSNSNEAMDEISADIEEGAHSIIIKPALSYLDIINRARNKFDLPIIAYNVSGEYLMLNQLIKGSYASSDIIEEVLISIKRAGANRIISYFTPYILNKYKS